MVLNGAPTQFQAALATMVCGVAVRIFSRAKLRVSMPTANTPKVIALASIQRAQYIHNMEVLHQTALKVQCLRLASANSLRDSLWEVATSLASWMRSRCQTSQASTFLDGGGIAKRL